jgi:hypothetical protein
MVCCHLALAVPGVTIYFSDFKRSLVDKLQKVRQNCTFGAAPAEITLLCELQQQQQRASCAADVCLL